MEHTPNIRKEEILGFLSIYKNNKSNAKFSKIMILQPNFEKSKAILHVKIVELVHPIHTPALGYFSRAGG